MCGHPEQKCEFRQQITISRAHIHCHLGGNQCAQICVCGRWCSAVEMRSKHSIHTIPKNHCTCAYITRGCICLSFYVQSFKYLPPFSFFLAGINSKYVYTYILLYGPGAPTNFYLFMEPSLFFLILVFDFYLCASMLELIVCQFVRNENLETANTMLFGVEFARKNKQNMHFNSVVYRERTINLNMQINT